MPPDIFCFLGLFAWDWPGIVILLISTSLIAGITDVYHHAWPIIPFLNLFPPWSLTCLLHTPKIYPKVLFSRNNDHKRELTMAILKSVKQ
jgi:hypothetical protein